MPKYPKPPKGWWSCDTYYFIPKRKRPIAYSTIGASRLIVALSEDGCTVNELRKKITYDEEAQKVIDQYIKYGYGEYQANRLFR